MDKVWYDNRPCDRAEPHLRRLVFLALAGIQGVGAVLFYFLVVALGESQGAGVIAAALLCGGGATVMVITFLWIEAGMPREIAFDEREVTIRTRSNRLRTVPYSEIIRISASRWKDDWSGSKCNRYVVLLNRRESGIARLLWLTPTNLNRLKEARKEEEE